MTPPWGACDNNFRAGVPQLSLPCPICGETPSQLLAMWWHTRASHSADFSPSACLPTKMQYRLTFAHVAGVEPTNNTAERGLRGGVNERRFRDTVLSSVMGILPQVHVYQSKRRFLP